MKTMNDQDFAKTKNIQNSSQAGTTQVQTKAQTEAQYQFQSQVQPPPYRLSLYGDYFACERLIVRPTFPWDFEHFQDCFADAEHVRYFRDGKTVPLHELMKSWHNAARQNIDGPKPETSGWTIITHGGVAGRFSAWRISEDAIEKENIGKVEIGYFTRPKFKGRNLSVEAGNLILNSALFTPPLYRNDFFATVHPKNIASQKVVFKLGFMPDLNRLNVPNAKYNQPRDYWQKPNQADLTWGYWKQQETITRMVAPKLLEPEPKNDTGSSDAGSSLPRLSSFS